MLVSIAEETNIVPHKKENKFLKFLIKLGFGGAPLHVSLRYNDLHELTVNNFLKQHPVCFHAYFNHPGTLNRFF